MKRLRRHLSFANVIACLALFVALGGASYAAFKLPKNSVGTKQLKRNAVTAAKLRNGAVTGAKIADKAITGSKIDLGTLGAVPDAAHAASADRAATAGSASTAGSAENAGNVNGQTPHKISWIFPLGQTVTISVISGFRIEASCMSNDVKLTLISPKTSGSVLAANGYNVAGPAGERDYGDADSAKAGTSSEIRLDSGEEEDRGEVSFSGGLATGLVVSGELGYDYVTFGGESPERCMIFGEATTG